jgi:hypothetical protein
MWYFDSAAAFLPVPHQFVVLEIRWLWHLYYHHLIALASKTTSIIRVQLYLDEYELPFRPELPTLQDSQ